MDEVFEDPISFEIMVEAIVTPCGKTHKMKFNVFILLLLLTTFPGHSFSKATIEEWLENGKLSYA